MDDVNRMTDTIREIIDIDPRQLEEALDRIRADAPSLERLLPAMQTFITTAAATDPDALYAETYDLRRSHLAVLLTVVEAARQQLADVLADTALDDRLPDADVAAPVHEGLRTAGEALIRSVQVLAVPPDRR